MIKKIFIVFCLLLAGLSVAQEGFKVGLHGSVPVGDNQEITSLAVGVETGYMFALGESADLGAMVGFINGFPEKYNQEPGDPDLPNVQFLPLAASVRVWPSNSLSVGGELGMAVGLNDGNDGGLYYKPIIGYLMGAQTEVNLSFTGIKVDDMEWATINLGILYTFPQNRF
jgi:hypothetical protein